MTKKRIAVVTKLRRSELRDGSRQIHRKTLKQVEKFLQALGVRYRILDRSQLRHPLREDLILAVGGDGTVLAASHHAFQPPILGINSAPTTSIGYYCKAGPSNFQEHILEALEGKPKPKLLPRLEVRINGKRFPCYGLNDFLFASRLQGDTARYWLRIGDREEFQKSSGLWVSTGGGSTGAILSAGGRHVSVFSKKLQYRVREPLSYPSLTYRLLHGFIPPAEKLTLISDMNEGMIFVDGAKLHQKVRKDSKIVIQGNVKPLKIFL